MVSVEFESINNLYISLSGVNGVGSAGRFVVARVPGHCPQEMAVLVEARSVCEAAEGLLNPAGQGGLAPSHHSFCSRDHIWHCSFFLCISETQCVCGGGGVKNPFL